MTLPLAVLAGFAPLTLQTLSMYQSSGFDGATQSLVAGTTGYSRWEGKWRAQYLMAGMGPIVLGILAHKVASRLGVNRALANAGVPVIRI